MRKLWLDVETTGLDSKEHGVIQLACLVENKQGEIIDKFEIRIKPFKGCIYSADAKKVHGKSKKEIKTYVPEKEAVTKFILWLQKYQINKEQYSITGYNSRFDQEFIISLFERNNIPFWTYFNYYDIDVFALIKILDLSGTFEGKKSKKLVAVCNSQGIKINAHDALSDIEATRKLYNKVMKKLAGGL